MGRFHRRGNAAVHKRHKIEEPRGGNIAFVIEKREEEEVPRQHRKWWTFQVKSSFTGRNKKEAKKKAKKWFRENCVEEMELVDVEVQHIYGSHLKPGKAPDDN